MTAPPDEFALALMKQPRERGAQLFRALARRPSQICEALLLEMQNDLPGCADNLLRTPADRTARASRSRVESGRSVQTYMCTAGRLRRVVDARWLSGATDRQDRAPGDAMEDAWNDAPTVTSPRSALARALKNSPRFALAVARPPDGQTAAKRRSGVPGRRSVRLPRPVRRARTVVTHSFRPMNRHADALRCGLRRSLQRLVECFGGCHPAEGLSRASVEFGGDGVEVVLGDGGRGRGVWGSTGAAVRWCSRWSRVATGCGGRRSRRGHRWRR
jgi:hypothetical protein